MLPTVSRRSFLARGARLSSALAAGAAAGPFIQSSKTRAAAGAPAVEILETKVISHQPEYYHGWSTLTRRQNGQLLVSWSGGRESHVCPFGRVEFMRSDDDGATWTWPRVLLDGPIDDRDSGVLETASGALLVTTFTSLAYADRILDKGKNQTPEWLAAHNRIPEEARRKELGEFVIRSTDDGITWSERIHTIVNSPHGPIQLSDGRLLYPGVRLWDDPRAVGVCESKDDGLTWQWIADIPTREGDQFTAYHELHSVECPSGKIIVHIRNHNEANKGETLQCESTDGGKTWSSPHAIGVWGLPSFLTRLRDGRLLMSYGHRRKPFGNQARLSEDEGATWSEPIIISGDGANGDLGYPSTVELGDGSLLTVWYEQMADSKKAVLRQARWKLA